MSSALLIRLSGDAEAAVRLLREAFGVREVNVRSLADLGTVRALRSRLEHIAVLGEPPSQEIGFGLLPFVALFFRPQRVVMIDARANSATDYSLAKFVLRTLGGSIVQMAASATAIPLQRLLAESLRHSAGVRTRTKPEKLGRMLYLRPHAGVAAGVGGSVTHTHEVIRAVRTAGIVVKAVTTDASIAKTAAAEPVPPCTWWTLKVPRPLKALPASTMLGVDLAMALAAYRSARQTDVIYQRHARFSVAGALLSRLTRKPLFLEYNGSEVYTGSHWGQRTPLLRQLRACERAALRSAAAIVVVAEASRTELIGMGVDPTRILMNPNGVDAQRFARGGGKAIRRALGVENAELIGFVGSFGPWHGAPVLAHAFAEIALRRPRACLLLVGDGPQRGDVLQILGDREVADRAVLVRRVQPAQVPGYLDACDVLVSPHVDLGGGVDFFGSPTKLFEYMASGKPIVASRLGQIGEVLVDGESAILVTPGDQHELVGALERLLDDRVAAAKLGAAARRAAVQRHSWRENAARVINRYEQLAATGSAR